MNLEAKLTQLERAELLRRLEQEDIAYIFKHALTQETAYQSLLLKRRRSIHRRVAETYEIIYADRVEEFASLLTHHYAEAGEIKPFGEIRRTITRQFGGHIIGVDLDQDDPSSKNWIYSVRMLSNNGKVLVIQANAATGKILDVKGEK